jgi:uncharacterized membrane protein YwzB
LLAVEHVSVSWFSLVSIEIKDGIAKLHTCFKSSPPKLCAMNIIGRLLSDFFVEFSKQSQRS